MFYHVDLLGRKGRYSIWWRIAHNIDTKGTRREVRRADIKEGVESVLHAHIPIALRIQGFLMVGLVRSYDFKMTEHSERVHHLLRRVSEWSIVKDGSAKSRNSMTLAQSTRLHSLAALDRDRFDENSLAGVEIIGRYIAYA